MANGDEHGRLSPRKENEVERDDRIERDQPCKKQHGSEKPTAGAFDGFEPGFFESIRAQSKQHDKENQVGRIAGRDQEIDQTKKYLWNMFRPDGYRKEQAKADDGKCHPDMMTGSPGLDDFRFDQG